MKRKTIGIAFIAFGLMASGALALWISGWGITGNMAISGGTQPANQENAILFSGATGDVIANATYVNSDGIQVY